MTGQPVIITQRLELWQPTAGDIEPMFAIVSDPQTGRFLGQGSDFADHFVRFSRNAGSWLLYGYGGFILRLRGEDEPIGTCGIFHSWRGVGEDFDDSPEAGWILRADSVGKGFAGEAMEAVFAWFDEEHGPRRVVCMIDPANAPSIGFARKLGFAPLREAVLPCGEQISLFERLP